MFQNTKSMVTQERPKKKKYKWLIWNFKFS